MEQQKVVWSRTIWPPPFQEVTNFGPSRRTRSPKWWATYGKHVPLLASVACLVLAQPVCASAAERNWSVYGKIKNDTTSRMSHEVADKRVYCHEALHITRKLQSAGYKQSVEKWDSDSDSDASEDEDLEM